MISRSRLLAGVAVVAAALPLRSRAQELEKIRLVAVPTDDQTPLYHAIRNGLFQKVGLDVEVVPATSGTAGTTAVVAGTYEMGKGSVMGSLLAHLRGLPLVIVGNGAIWDTKAPFAQMLVAADSAVRSGADLNGKIAAAAALNDVSQLAISVWVDKSGGSSGTLKFVEIPNSAAATALIDHRIDVCCLSEPYLTPALESGKVRSVGPGYSAIADHFALTVYFANADWAAKHANLVKAFLRVAYEAAAYTNAHHAETVAMMSAVTKIPVATLQKIARVDGSTSSDPALIQTTIDLAAKYHNIPRAFPAKEAYFTP
jgi:NitT/TauT family transport system substrate-binding protein